MKRPTKATLRYIFVTATLRKNQSKLWRTLTE